MQKKLNFDQNHIEKTDLFYKKYRVVHFMPDKIHFKNYSLFFASIGYIANTVAKIEDVIRQNLIDWIRDPKIVFSLTAGKNLGGLIPTYEMSFLSKFQGDEENLSFFYKVKGLLLKANSIRNEAVHSDWQFTDSKISAIPFYEHKNGHECVIVLQETMHERAMFILEVFWYMENLRAATSAGKANHFDDEVIANAKERLRDLSIK
jgi:hypothetical protein